MHRPPRRVATLPLLALLSSVAAGCAGAGPQQGGGPAAVVASSPAGSSGAPRDGAEAAVVAASRDPAQRRAVLDNARNSLRDALDCPDAAAEVGETLALVGTPRADAAGRLVEGGWMTPVRVSGCGPTTRLNVLTMVVPGRETRRVGMLPGTTRAGPTLQLDARRGVAPYASRLLGGCPQTATVNTVDRGPSGPPVAPGLDAPWSEAWTVRGCGRSVDVPVDFIPNARGTAFAVGGGGTPS